MICKKCGRENPPGAAICANCGDVLTRSATLSPGAGSSLAYGWRVMWRNFWGFFLAVFVYNLITAAIVFGSWIVYYWFSHTLFSFRLAMMRFDPYRWPWGFEVVTIVIGALIFIPLQFGLFSLFLGPVRGERVKFDRFFDAFRNYPGVFLVSVTYYLVITVVYLLLGWLTGEVFGLGVFLLLVWTVIFIVLMCRLVFVPFLITDRKMKWFNSITTSWRLSAGHAGQAFGIGFLLVLVGVGLGLLSLLLAWAFGLEQPSGVAIYVTFIVLVEIVGYMWSTAAFASLYYAVSVFEKDYSPASPPFPPAP